MFSGFLIHSWGHSEKKKKKQIWVEPSADRWTNSNLCASACHRGGRLAWQLWRYSSLEKTDHCRPMAHGLSWISDRWIPCRIHKTIYDPSPKYPDCCCLWMSLISLFTMNHHRFTIILRLPCHSFATFWWLNTPRASRREVKTRKNNSNTSMLISCHS